MLEAADSGERHATLRHQLSILARGRGIWKDDLVDLLATDLADLRDKWQVSSTWQAPDSVRKAVGKALLSHLRDIPSYQDGPGSKSKRVVLAQIFKLGFNLATPGPSALLESRLHEAPVSLRTAKRYLDFIYEEITKQILDAGFVPRVPAPPASPRPAIKGQPTPAPAHKGELAESSHQPFSGLIERHEYLGKVTALLADRGTIFLWGEAGTGKSTLALDVARKFYPGPVALLRVGDEKVLEADILDALLVEDIEPVGLSPALCRAKLRSALSGTPRHSVVVVDGLEALSDLKIYIPDAPAIPVFVTTRLRPADKDVVALEVKGFDRDESRAFVGARIPDADPADRNRLIEILGDRPLALDHATRYLCEDTGITVLELVRELGKGIASNLDLIALGCAQAPSLPRLYEVMLEAILSNGAVREVLDAFLGLTGMQGMVEETYFDFMLSTMYHTASTEKLPIHSGLLALRNYGLVRKVGTLWQMHSLTWEILRELRGSAPHEVEHALLAFLSSSDDSAPVAKGDLGRLHARILQMELLAGSNLLAGWRYLFNIDRHTWLAVCEQQVDDGTMQIVTMRYKTTSVGVYREDFATRNKSLVSKRDAIDLYRSVKLYNIVSEAVTRKVEKDGDWGADVNQFQSFLAGRDNEFLIERVGDAIPGSMNDDQRRDYLIAAADRVHSFSDSAARQSLGQLKVLTNVTLQQIVDDPTVLPLEELLTFVGWLIDDGNASAALGILNDFARHLKVASGRPMGESFLMAARALLATGNLDNADKCIARADDQFATHEQNRHYVTHGLIRCYALRLELLTRRGRVTDGQLQTLAGTVRQIWDARPSGFHGPATEARFHRLMGATEALMELNQWRPTMGTEGTSERNIQRACDHLAKAHKLALATYRSRRECAALYYDLQLAQWLAGHMSGDETVREATSALVAHSQGAPQIKVYIGGDIRPLLVDTEWTYRRILGGAKCLLLDNFDDEKLWLDVDELEGFQRIATYFGAWGSGWWYSETLAVMCVMARIVGVSAAKYLAAASESYEYIGRSDRGERLVELLSVDLSDREKFKQQFSYFLTW